MDVVLEVLKWVAIVFAAGVVGQLGKSLTLKILAARRRRQQAPEAQARPAGVAASTVEPIGTSLDKRELKRRKKDQKAAVKLRKKGRD